MSTPQCTQSGQQALQAPTRQLAAATVALVSVAKSRQLLLLSLRVLLHAGLTGLTNLFTSSTADRFHCYFYDPNINWNQYISMQNGVLTFDRWGMGR